MKKLREEKSDLFYICFRTLVYSVMLSLYLFNNVPKVNFTETLTVISFTGSVVLFELLMRYINFSKYLAVYFVVLVSLCAWIMFLLHQASNIQDHWNRINVVESRFEKIILDAPKPVLISDGLGNIKYVNSNMERYVGKNHSELVGTNIRELMDSSFFDTSFKGLKPGDIKWIDVGNKIFVVKNFKGISRPTRVSLLITKFLDARHEAVPSGKDIELYIIFLNSYWN